MGLCFSCEKKCHLYDEYIYACPSPPCTNDTSYGKSAPCYKNSVAYCESNNVYTNGYKPPNPPPPPYYLPPREPYRQI